MSFKCYQNETFIFGRRHSYQKKRKKEKKKIHENNQLRKKHIHDFY